MNTPDSANPNEFVFVQYTECTNKLDLLNDTGSYVRLRASTDDELYHTQISQTVKRKRIVPVVGVWFGKEPLSGI